MNQNTTLLFVVSFLAIIFSCDSNTLNDDDTNPEPIEGTFDVDAFEAKDLDNTGTSADVFLDYQITSDINEIDKLFVIISTEAISLTEDLTIPGEGMHELVVQASYAYALPEGVTDFNEQPIQENIQYFVYLLATFHDTSFTPSLSDPVEIILKNESIVTTPILTGTFRGNEDIAIDENGNLYVNGGSLNTSNVYKITPTGHSTVFSNELNYPVGIDIDAEGSLYVSNFNNHSINKIDANGTTTVWAQDSQLSGGGGIAIGSDQMIYNTFWSSFNLFQISQGTVEIHCQHGQFNGPVGLTYVEETDKLYVASFNSGKIFEVIGESINEIADTPVSIGHIEYANGYFYVTGYREHQVIKLSLEGEIAQTYGNGSIGTVDGSPENAQFSNPNGIAISKDGLYVYVSQGNGKLRKIVNARED